MSALLLSFFFVVFFLMLKVFFFMGELDTLRKRQACVKVKHICAEFVSANHVIMNGKSRIKIFILRIYKFCKRFVINKKFMFNRLHILE